MSISNFKNKEKTLQGMTKNKLKESLIIRDVIKMFLTKYNLFL